MKNLPKGSLLNSVKLASLLFVFLLGLSPNLLAIPSTLLPFTEKLEGKLSFYYKPVFQEESVDFEDTVPMNPASVMKIPIMVTVFQLVQNHELDWQDKIPVYPEDLIGGAGVIYLNPEPTYSVRKLVELMILTSDNTAAYVLAQLISPNRINETMSRLGLQNTIMGNPNLLKSEGQNFTTAKDMGLLLGDLYRGRIVSAEASQDMMRLMMAQKYRWGIPKYLPGSVRVANKTGSLAGIKNDCGIVFYKKRPYILTIFTQNLSSAASGEQIVSELSQAIFNWASAQN